MANEKKDYETPELSDYGTIEDVTKGTGIMGQDVIAGVVGAVQPSPIETGDPGSGPLGA